MVGNAPGIVALVLGLVLLVTVNLSSATRRGRRHDHICQYYETKKANCTRIVYYPCPKTSNSSNSTAVSSNEDVTDVSSSVNDYLNQFINRYYRRRHVSNWCRQEQTYPCTMYRCYVACCPGWKYDEETKKCSISADEEEPHIDCLNGGSPFKDNDGPRCECPQDFTGTRCEERICNLVCQNDGLCDVLDDMPRCVCPIGFSGEYCESPRCDGGCGYGTCELMDGRTTCRCHAGFTGERCDLPDIKKNGDCPPTLSSYGTCEKSCQVDSTCPGDTKCCFNGCGHKCTSPAVYTCSHQGKDYDIGDVFNPDACHVCTCLIPDPSKPYGGAKCSTVQCPPREPGCEAVYDEDTCCGRCKVVEPPEDKYTKPHFTNCPNTLVTVDVVKSKNEAFLPFTLKAKTYKDVSLKVILSTSKFKAGSGAENFETVLATSERDSRGNYAYCQFHVWIRDVHPPTFSFCPPDVSLTEEGKADWDEPEVSDNVGLERPPTSSSKKTDHYFKGDHLVVYTAKDYEGNTATCKFFIRVSIKGFTHGRDLTPVPESKRDWHKYALYGGAALVVLLLVATIIIIALVCIRRRRIRRETTTASPPAYDNAVYGITSPAQILPAYKEKPPIYEDISIKEKKEGDDDAASLDVKTIEPKSGVENPMYKF